MRHDRLTVADSFAAACVSHCRQSAGKAAARLDANKRNKYYKMWGFPVFPWPTLWLNTCPGERWSFCSALAREGRNLLSAMIGHLITKITGDPKETSFLFLNLSVISHHSARKCRRFQTKSLLGCSVYFNRLGISFGN